jgi:hypothetical protein
MDQAATSSHDEFISWSHALLSDLKGVRHDDEAAVDVSGDGHSGNADDVSERERESRFTAPSTSVHSLREQQFKAKIAEDFPNLCSDSLPLDGPSATLPNGELYSVKLKLKQESNRRVEDLSVFLRPIARNSTTRSQICSSTS